MTIERQWATLVRALLTCPASELRGEPKPGDLVIETTSCGSVDPDGIGWLLRIEGNPPIVDRWVIEPINRPGEEQGWQNADFLAVPQRIADRVRRAADE